MNKLEKWLVIMDVKLEIIVPITMFNGYSKFCENEVHLTPYCLMNMNYYISGIVNETPRKRKRRQKSIVSIVTGYPYFKPKSYTYL